MRLVAILMALWVVLAPALAQPSSGMALSDAWARATPGARTTGAAYLTLANAGAATDRLIAVSTPIARSVELHTTVRDGDILRMQALDTLGIAPGSAVELKPGGIHIMLLGLKAPLKEETTFPLTLTFAAGGDLTVDVAVRGAGAMGPTSQPSQR